jgi:hypothetical protein
VAALSSSVRRCAAGARTAPIGLHVGLVPRGRRRGLGGRSPLLGVLNDPQPLGTVRTALSQTESIAARWRRVDPGAWKSIDVVGVDIAGPGKKLPQPILDVVDKPPRFPFGSMARRPVRNFAGSGDEVGVVDSWRMALAAVGPGAAGAGIELGKRGRSPALGSACVGSRRLLAVCRDEFRGAPNDRR